MRCRDRRAGSRGGAQRWPAAADPNDPPTRPVVAMLSGGRDSVCLLDVAVALRGAGSVRALHVNYGLRGAESDADERHCAALCEQLGVELEIVRASRAQGEAGQPAGVGAGPALRGGDRAGRARGRARRGRAHGQRPGRDDPLPAGGLAGAPRAAGDGAEEGRLVASVAGVTREQTAGVLRSAGTELARGREQRLRRVRARARQTRTRGGAAGGAPGGRGERAADRGAAARGDRAAGRSRRGRRWQGGRASRSRAWQSWRGRWRDWSWCVSPSRRRGPMCPRRAIAWRRSWSWAGAAAPAAAAAWTCTSEGT